MFFKPETIFLSHVPIHPRCLDQPLLMIQSAPSEFIFKKIMVGLYIALLLLLFPQGSQSTRRNPEDPFIEAVVPVAAAGQEDPSTQALRKIGVFLGSL